MNTKNPEKTTGDARRGQPSDSRKIPFYSRMAVRLWLIMMVLVVFTVILMWLIQVLIMERNYVNMAVDGIQDRLDPIMEELMTDDLAENENLIPYLSKAADGKLLLVDGKGGLTAMYSYGLPINLESDSQEITVWQDIQNSDSYASVLERESYTREKRKDGRLYSYEMGIPVKYEGQDAYVILYHSFTELYEVLDMNRKQLVTFSILLSIVSAVLAALLSKSFTKPIHIIKGTVDELAKGDLTAEPDLVRKDEIGQLAESVRQLGRALQRVDDLRKEVIANVSHELRSPLALISGYAEMVRDIHWKDREKREEDLDLIIRESHRMSEMVSDILDYSQLQAGYLQLRRDWYNLVEIVDSEVLLCEQSAAEHQITLHLDAPEREIAAYVDALKISQVVRNLLYNAVNHTKDGMEITVEIEKKDGQSTVRVKNPGEAIPEEERELIWERYQRSQHQGGRHEGTGLGLSIVSTILQAHGMEYGVDCRDGLNIFWFRYSPKGSRAQSDQAG
ncbi:MAG TPA: HAMP domain-containing histidine kinase [Candidatus Eisenbergiella merdipullorum]|uniref:histidine kinase n=1 Tax=Candidatus Eisenbergiella merdipullorum TaxID=2838553 RepID=A0A9D2I480_9FIRM|nr:HAMP domain-containing histidine kinase [Candidatus Eisenbergiella merdipullorum]